MVRLNDYLARGQGPVPLGSTGGGSLCGFPVENFQTPLLDLTTANLAIELVPARPGYAPIVNFAEWIISQKFGTQTSTATYRAGSNTGHSNFIASVSEPSNAQVNAGSSGPYIASSAFTALIDVKLIPNATVYLDVTAGASGTGGFALLASLSVSVAWVAVEA